VRPFDPSARPNLSKKPSQYLKENVFVTTSGNHYAPAFMCTKAALGIDRILLGTDFPYEDLDECMTFIQDLEISKQEKDKVYYKNARHVGIKI
jgi:predicted TIM-barrel fold metal-dependent hydrolase